MWHDALPDGLTPPNGMRLTTKTIFIHKMTREYATLLMYVWRDSLPDEARNPNGPHI